MTVPRSSSLTKTTAPIMPRLPISVLDRKYFTNSSAFYRLLFHEIRYSTGHPKRLNSYDLMSNSISDIPYSKEVLVAEVCSYLPGSFTLTRISVTQTLTKGWASALRDNQKCVMWTAARAEKAADHPRRCSYFRFRKENHRRSDHRGSGT